MYQDNLKPIFFLRKKFKRTKTQIKSKPTNKIKLSEQKATKATIFQDLKTSERGKWVLLLF